MKRSSRSISFPLALRLSAAIVLLHLCSVVAWAADSTDLQLKLVEQRIDTLKQQGESAEDNATLQAYQSTLNWLRETRNFEQMAEQFINAQKSTAQEEASMLSRASTSKAKSQLLDTNTLEKMSWTALEKQASQMRDTLQELLTQRDSLDRQIAAEASNAERTRTRLSAIDLEEGDLPDSDAHFEMGGVATQFEATQWQLAAHRSALEAERKALNAQLASQPNRSRLRRVEREDLVRTIEQLQQQLSQLEALQATRQAPQKNNVQIPEAQAGTPGFELLQRLSSENAGLAEHRAQISSQITLADGEKARMDGKLFEVMEQFGSARRLVESGGRASLYGPFLMNYYLGLNRFRPPAERLRISNSIDEIVVDRALHEQQLSELLDYDVFISTQLGTEEVPASLPGEVLDSVKQLLQERSNLLNDLMKSETELIQLLGKTDVSYGQLGSLVNEFRAFLIGHILWVRSHLPIDQEFFQQVLIDLREARKSLRSSMAFDGKTMPIIALLAGLLLLLFRRGMWRRIEAINRHIGRPRNDSIVYSLKVLFLTLLRSAAVPLIGVGIGLSIVTSPQGLLHPLAVSLLVASVGAMTALFLRDATAPGGICRVHFDWPEHRCKAVSSLMTWVLVRLMPVAIVASFLVNLEQNLPHAVLSRGFLSIITIMLAFKALRMLHRHRKQQPEQVSIKPSGRGFPVWLQNGIVWVLAGFQIFIVLSGFLLPARIIYFSLGFTALTIVTLIFLHELLMRWLLVARRRIRFQQLMAVQPGSEGEEKAEKEARQAASLGDITDSTAQLIKSLAYASAALALFLIWKPLMPAIQGLQRFTLWTVSQTVNGEQLQTQITLATIVMAMLIFIVTFYAARRLPALIDLVMRSTGNSTPSTRYTVSTITNYVIIAIGTMVFFSTLKMSWSQLQWLVAALGVGIGFGLQEIVANFISGLIILFERPIRVGDVVTVGESSGTVTRIQIRATTIRDWDGKELLVPNKEFITGRLLNWTLTDTNNRVVIDVGIAYGSDVAKAMQILQDVVTGHPAILDDPKPNILFTQFGDSALLLSARCFLADLEDRQQRISELNQQIYAAFNEAGIVIAFPQLDVHLDPDSPLTVRLQKESAQPANY